MERYNLEIRNIEDINMSNWQITHTVNTLTTINNKFDILNRLNGELQKGCSKSNIFMIDKSYSFSTSYKTYFTEDITENELLQIDVDKLYNMGRIVTMEPNDTIMNINIVFDFYRKLNSIINTHFKCRFKKRYLNTAVEIVYEGDIDKAIEYLFESSEEQILGIYNNRINPDYMDMNKIITECKELKNTNKIRNKNKDFNKRSMERFTYYFNTCARPIVGIYDEEWNCFELINAKQMYQNGEEDLNQIKLNKITKNSPVLLAFSVVGVMAAVMGYLAYREHCVNDIVEDKDIVNVPTDRKNALINILGSNDNAMLNKQDVPKVDERVLGLALDTYGKLEGITDSRKVQVAYRKEEKNE